MKLNKAKYHKNSKVIRRCSFEKFVKFYTFLHQNYQIYQKYRKYNINLKYVKKRQS